MPHSRPASWRWAPQRMQPLIITLKIRPRAEAEDPYEVCVRAAGASADRRPGGGIETANLAWNQALRGSGGSASPRRDPLLPQRIGELLRSFVTPLGWEEYAGQI